MTQTSDNFFGRHKVRAGVVVFVGLVISLPRPKSLKNYRN